MNLQTIAVIFAIIVIPISLVLSAYIGTHIDTLVYQSQYDSKLAEATYDAVKAFQLNTLNNQYSTISDSKIRDIEASVNVFFDSLGNNLDWGSYNENQVKEHIPALVYTLYDGYYIYSKYDNIGNPTLSNNKAEVLQGEEIITQYGLKPYIYYTCRYVNDSGSYDFIVNYTLDNAIVIYGYIDGTYQTVSGYMVGNKVDELAEELKEHLIFLDNNGIKSGEGDYKYYYNKDGTKIYEDGGSKFLYKDNKRVGTGTIDLNPINSAKEYNMSYYGTSPEYINSEKFRTVVENVKNNAINIYPTDGNIDLATGKYKNISGDVSFTTNVFDISKNPELSSSDFNEHKRAVIQRSIKSNLYTAMANFSRNSLSSYEFRMPEIDETEWDKVIGSVGVIAFMQGIPMGNKYYNDYCIISNNNNKEFVTEDSIYIVDKNQGTYHRVGCKHWNEAGIDWNNVQAYLNIDFRRQTVKGKIDEDGDGNYEDKNYYYYPQEAQACYDCIISQNGVNSSILNDSGFKDTDLGKIFYRALAREKYNLYKVNDYLNDT